MTKFHEEVPLDTNSKNKKPEAVILPVFII